MLLPVLQTESRPTPPQTSVTSSDASRRRMTRSCSAAPEINAEVQLRLLHTHLSVH